jgi:MFS family permease
LLAISLKSRLSLHESPVFRRLREKNTLSRTPLRDCLTDRHTLGRMALLFFCISAGGSLLFFSSQVYTSVFLKNVVRLDAQLAGTLVMLATLTLFPLTILFGWLSDRIGRRPVLLAGLLLGCLTLVPIFKGLLHYGNPTLERFNNEVEVILSGSACNYDPFTAARNDCERNQETLVKLGVGYTLENSLVDREASIKVGSDSLVKGFHPEHLTEALKAKGWTPQADSSQANQPMLVILMMMLVVAVALITGPQTATLAELFPARTRYSAVALPHNLSAGWIGGLSPFMVTFLSVKGGNVLSGLWYPAGLLTLAFMIGLIFLPETANTPLDD